MKKINLKQRENLAGFFREISVAFVSVGGFTAVFDKSLLLDEIIYRFIYSILITILLLVISLLVIKK